MDNARDKFHKLALNGSFERVARVAKERAEFNRLMALSNGSNPMDNVPMHTPEVAALVEALRQAVAIVQNCDVSEGVCCCGDNMDDHAEPMLCGHTPTDHGNYCAGLWITDAKATLAAWEASQ